MKNKFLGIALILLILIAVGIVFAAGGASISRTATTVTVTNTNKTGTIKGDVCVYLIHKNGENKITDNFPYGPLRAGQSETYTCPSDWTIYNASEISCFVIPE